MRMWKVDPKKMCRKHLLGEHVEMHMFVGTINKGISIEGYLDRRLVEVGYINRRHDELVEEMLRRGYKHNKSLPNLMRLPKRDITISVADSEAELRRRCKDCQF